MSRRLQENIIAVSLLGIFVILFFASLSYGPRARLVPLPIACLAILLLIAQLYWQNFRSPDDLKVDMMEIVGADKRIAEVEEKFAPALAAVAPPDELKRETSLFRREISACGMVLTLLAAMMTLGPLPAVFSFTTAYLGLSKQKAWVTSALIGFSCAGFLYITFGYFLGQKLNQGLLAPIIGQYVNF